jgi:hypothetical protein
MRVTSFPWEVESVERFCLVAVEVPDQAAAERRQDGD